MDNYFKKYLKYKKKYLELKGGASKDYEKIKSGFYKPSSNDYEEVQSNYKPTSIVDSDNYEELEFDIYEPTLNCPDVTTYGINMKELQDNGNYIGEGYWGKTYSYNLGGREVVIKLSNSSNDKFTNAMNKEISFLESIKSEADMIGIPIYIGCFMFDGRFGFIMGKKDGIQLTKFISDRIDEISKIKSSQGNVDKAINDLKLEMISIYKKIISALNILHEKSIYHKDIWSNNILYDIPKKKINLVDFGLTCTNQNISLDFNCRSNNLPYTRIYKNYSEMRNDKSLENKLSDMIGTYNIIKNFEDEMEVKFEEYKRIRYFETVATILNHLNKIRNDRWYNNEDINNMLKLISLTNCKINTYQDLDKLNTKTVVLLHQIGIKLGLSLDLTLSKSQLIEQIMNAPLIIYQSLDQNIINKFTNNSIGCNINLSPMNQLIGGKYRNSEGNLNIISVSLFQLDSELKFKYLTGLVNILSKFPQVYPNFVLRIYYDSSLINNRRFNDLRVSYKNLKHIQFAKYFCPRYSSNRKVNDHEKLFGAISRFFPLNETDIGTLIFRDIDFIPHKHDNDHIQLFINSTACLHQYYLEEYKSTHALRMNTEQEFILAGAWGVKNDILHRNNIFLMKDFLNILATKQDVIIKNIYYDSDMSIFNYGFDEVIINEAIYNLHVKFFSIPENRMVRDVGRLLVNFKILEGLTANEDYLLKQVFSPSMINQIKERMRKFPRDLRVLYWILRNHPKKTQIVNKIYDIFDKTLNKDLNIVWFELILPYN